jgi:hypothetical protein
MNDATSSKARARVASAAESGVVEFMLGDVVSLRRAHPCGGRDWLVDRLGADVGLRCSTCGRHVLLERRTLERRLIGFASRGNLEMSRAVAPVPRDADRGRGGVER